MSGFLATLNWFAQRLTGGRRDFASVHWLEAGRYAVYVEATRLDEALRLDLL